jgi:CHAT domain-containing protein
MRPALEALLGFYERVLSPMLEALAPALELEGKHLKIFPRFVMNQAPLHAVRIGNRRLFEICDVSYAPSLSLFLLVHQGNAALAPGTLTILHDAARAQPYAGTIRALTAQAANAIVTVPDPSWQNLQSSLEQHPTTDILFACHGQFNGDDPSKSRLEITRRESVDFEKIYTDLDLRGYRSVFIGACESGLGRTLVSAEYIGLPMAFLAGGARYVIGTLWEVTKLPAAILVARHYELLLGGTRPVVNCLNEAMRHLRTMPRNEVMAWAQQFFPEKAAEIEKQLQNFDDPPFAHPYYWAGFQVSGDA